MPESIDDIVRRALYWVYVFNGRERPSPETENQFASWITATSEHARQYTLATAYYLECRRLGPIPVGDVEQWIKYGEETIRFHNRRNRPNSIGEAAGRSDARQSAEPDIRASVAGRLRWVGIHRRSLAATAALIAVLLVAAGFFFRIDRVWTSYGASSTVRLDNGSTLALGVNSAAEVRNTTSLSEVRLLKGQGAFDVARNPLRPFRVRVDGGVIEVLGTHFVVSVDEQGATVEVQAGKVRVAARSPSKLTVDLGPGKSARILADGTLRVGAGSEIIDKLPLGKLVSMVNDRGHSPQIVVRGTACRKTVSGQWNLDDVDSFVGWLESQDDLKVLRTGAIVRVRTNGDFAPAEPGECDTKSEADSPRP